MEHVIKGVRTIFNPFMYYGYDTEDINEKVKNYDTDEEYKLKFIKFCIESYEDDKKYFKDEPEKLKILESRILEMKNALQEINKQK
jgi:hypothetical protein